MDRTVCLAGLEVRPGEEKVGHIAAGTLAGGTECRIGFRIVNGARPGPRLGLLSVLQGSEPMGAEIIRRVFARIAADRLRGAVLAVPIANPFALEFGGTAESSGTAVNPSDHLDLDQVFPGRERHAWLTEQMAFHLHEAVLRQVDCLLDLRDGTGAGVMMPVALFPALAGELGDRVVEVAKAFGAPVAAPTAPHPGSAAAACLRLGIPAITPHVAGLGIMDEHVEQGVTCILNTMRLLAMIDGRPAHPPRQIVTERYLIYRAEEGGFFDPEPSLRLGAVFAEGQVLARVIDPLTSETKETCTAPFRGMVTQHRVRLPVNPGGTICHLADLDSVVWERVT